MRKTYRFLCAGVACLAVQPVWAQVPDAPASQAQATTAANQPTPDPGGQRGGRNSGQVEDIIVTARKVSESSQSVPISITAVSEARMRDLQIQNYSDLSRTTPNLFVTRYNSNPASPLITIRGIAQQNVTLNIDSPIGVYVDGVYLPHSFGLDASMIDVARVEVLKGSQGTLFGRNTTGGAINVTTHDPDMKGVGGFIDATAGNYGAVGVSGAINIPLSSTLALRLVGSESGRGAYGHDFQGRPLNNDRSRFARGKLLWTPTDKLRVLISGDYQKLTNDGSAFHLSEVNSIPSTVLGTPATASALLEAARELGLPTTTAGLQQARTVLASYIYGQPNGPKSFYDGGAFRPQSGYYKGGGGSIDVTADLTDSLHARSITAFRAFRREDINDLNGAPFKLLYADSIGRSKNVSQELQLLGNSRRFNWIVGGFVNFEDAHDDSSSESVPAINPNNPNITLAHLHQSSEAIFGQATYELTDTLRVTGGLRYTWELHKNTSGNRAGPLGNCSIGVALRTDPTVCSAKFETKNSDYSYLASIDWKPIHDVLVYAKTSRGFKGGGLNLQGTSDPSGFAAFQPETVTDYEVGLKGDFLDRRLRVNISGFHSDYKNVQRSARILSPLGASISLFTNAAKARINGGEIEVTLKPTRELTLGFAGGITDAKYKQFFDLALGDRTGEPFPIPKKTYTINGGYDLPLPSGDVIRLTADYSWRSRVVFAPAAIFDDAAAQPAYGLVNGRLAYDAIGSQLTVAVFAKNIGAKRYYVAAGTFDNALGYDLRFVGTPRTYGIQIVKKFGGG